MPSVEIKVLLVEDDEDDFILTQELLNECGWDQYEIEWSQTYENGLKALRTGEADVCLVDYNIGERTGLEFVREALSEDLDTPLILLTGASDHEIDLGAARAGASDFLEKGALTAELLERSIRYAIRHTKNLVELKEIRRSLTEAKAQLEVKVQERTKELLTANEALEAEIAERTRAEQRLRHNAFHDRLTQLQNRELFLDRVDHAIGRAERTPECSFAVMVINLDRFKVVNDGLGHPAGDELLKIIANRLRDSVRPGDTVARIGGDDFAVLVEDVQVLKSAIACAKRLGHLLKEPILINAQEVFCTFSVGITVSALGYVTAVSMLQDAFTALNEAKRRGTGRIEVFEVSMRSNTAGLLKIEADLRRAVDQGDEFELHYQPIVELRNDWPAGFEALIRWRHPERGLVQPSEFIQIAEETGLITPIGRWVHQEAARQVLEWQLEYPMHRSLFVSVNVSGRQFNDERLVDDLRLTLAKSGLEPEFMKLEVTESILMDDPKLAADILTELKAIGVGVSIDDFGTGYSSLSYLRRFPFDTLKIDRSFVRAMAQGDEDLEVVHTIINLAGVLGMDVVAEGAETKEEVRCLTDLGCDFVQGFYFSPPVPVAEAAKLLERQSAKRQSSARQEQGKIIAMKR